MSYRSLANAPPCPHATPLPCPTPHRLTASPCRPQREELYCLLPQLATTPSADLVERLAAEAWPPTPPPQAQHLPPSLSRPSDLGGHSGGGGGGAGGGGGGLLPSAYSSPEAIASFLWIVAASGGRRGGVGVAVGVRVEVEVGVGCGVWGAVPGSLRALCWCPTCRRCPDPEGPC